MALRNSEGCLLGFEGSDQIETTDKFGLGQNKWEDGIEYLLLQNTINAGLVAGDWVYIQSDFTVTTQVTTATATYGRPIAVAQAVVADNEYFWAAVQGTGFVGRVNTGFLKDTEVYTTATAGVVDDASASSVLIGGGVRGLEDKGAGDTVTFASASRLHVLGS